MEENSIKKIHGVIFDLDGTLVNTLEDLADSVNEALTAMGYPTWQTEDYRLKVGRGFRNLIINSVPEDVRTDDKMIDRMLEHFLCAYDRRYMSKSRPYEGIIDMTAKLKEAGIPMAVNSNKRQDYTEKLIAHLFPDGTFAGIFGERKDIPRKPDPAGALSLCGMMGIGPEEAVYIGDSATDMQTGKNAGIMTIGVTWGFRGRKELEENGAGFIAEVPEDIVEFVKRF